MKLLIVEDEKVLSDSILQYLTRESFICEVADSYAGALEKIESFDYDCILLDITLKDGSGLGLLQRLKAGRKKEGVLIISARNALEDKLEGLHGGADDYLSKPFHLSELSARIAAIIRRRQGEGNNEIHLEEIVVDTMGRSVQVLGSPLDLTRKEYQLLLYFAYNRGRLIPKMAIAEHLSEEAALASDNYDFIYTHIKNLRRKLMDAGSRDPIQSVYGIGYKLII